MVANCKRKNKLCEISKLIRLYRANECLWNPKSPGFQNVALKENAWLRISQFFKDKLTIDQIKLQILSLRYYFATELLAIKRSQLDGYEFVPRHSYFKELLFLREALEHNVHVKLIAAKDQVSKQINCLVEDSFLLSSSENSLHSEQFDFPSSSTSDEINVANANITESLVSLVREQSSQFSLSPPNISSAQLAMRAVSGNDYLNPTANSYNYNDECDNYGQKRSRSHYPEECDHNRNCSISSEIVRSNCNQQPMAYPTERCPSQSTIDLNYNTYVNPPLPRACSAPRRKVLTGRYNQKPKRSYGAELDIEYSCRNNDHRNHRQQYRVGNDREYNQSDYRYAKSSKDVCREKSFEYRNNITAYQMHVEPQAHVDDPCRCCANCLSNSNEPDYQNNPRDDYNKNNNNTNATYDNNAPSLPPRRQCNSAICPSRSGRSRSAPVYNNVDQQPLHEPKQNERPPQNEEIPNTYEENVVYPDSRISDNRQPKTRPNEEERVYSGQHYRNVTDDPDQEEVRSQRHRTPNENMEDTRRDMAIPSPRHESKQTSGVGLSKEEPRPMSEDPHAFAAKKKFCTDDRKRLNDDNVIMCGSGRQRKMNRNVDETGRPRNDTDTGKHPTEQVQNPPTEDEGGPARPYNEENAGTPSRRQQRRDEFGSPKNGSRYKTNQPDSIEQGYYPENKQQPQRSNEGYITPDKSKYSSNQQNPVMNERSSYNDGYIEQDKRTQRYEEHDPNYVRRQRNIREKSRQDPTERQRDEISHSLCNETCFAKCSSGRSRKYNENPNIQGSQQDYKRRDDMNYRQGNYRKNDDEHSRGSHTYSKYQTEQDFNGYPANNQTGQKDYRRGDEEYDREKRYMSPNYQACPEDCERRDDCERERLRKKDFNDYPANNQTGQKDYRRGDDEYDREKRYMSPNYQACPEDCERRDDCERERLRKKDFNDYPANNQTGQKDYRRGDDEYDREKRYMSPNYQACPEDCERRDDCERERLRKEQDFNDYPANNQTGQKDYRRGDDEYDREKRYMSPNYQACPEDCERRDDCERERLRKKDFNDYPANNQTGQKDYRRGDDEYDREKRNMSPSYQSCPEDCERRERLKREARYNQGKETIPLKHQSDQDYYDARNDEEELHKKYDSSREDYKKTGDKDGEGRERYDKYNRDREPLPEKYQDENERKDDTNDRSKNREQEHQKYQAHQEDDERKAAEYNRTKDALPPKQHSKQDEIREKPDERNSDKGDIPGKYKTGQAKEGEGRKEGDDMQDCECPTDDEETAKLPAKEAQDPVPRKSPAPCRCEAAVETDIDMTLRNRTNQPSYGCRCSEDSLGTAERNKEKPNDEKSANLNENPQPPSTKAKPVKGKEKKPGKIYSCKPATCQKNKQVSKSPNSGTKQEPYKQRSVSPAGGKSRSHNRRQKLDDDKLQALGGQPRKFVYEMQEGLNICVDGLPQTHSGYEVYQRVNPKHLNASNAGGGLAILYSFRVPSTLAGETKSILDKHIALCTPAQEVEGRSNRSDRKLSRNRADCYGSNPSGNRAGSNPFLKLSFNASKNEVVVLHPPVVDFRASKYSCSAKDL